MTRFFAKHGWRYAPGVALLITCAWLQARAPRALGDAIELAGGGDFSVFARRALSILYIALGIFVTRFGWRYFIIGVSRELEVYLRDRLFDHLMYLPVDFYGRVRSGDIMAYAVNDVSGVRMMFGMVVAQVINAVTGVLFSVREMAASVNKNLTLLALAPIPLAIAAVLVIGRKIQSRSRRAQELFSTLSGHLQENINGMRVLKAFAQEDAQYIAFEAESDEKRLANTRLYDTHTLLHPLIQVIFGLSYLAGIAYGGQLAMDKVISLSDYVAFNAYLTYIVVPVMSIGRISNMLQRGLASFKRISSIMNEPELDSFERVPDDIPIRGGIEARGLTFTYPDSPSPALDGLSFSVPAGGVLGIAGPTGSGKSTVMMLIIKLLAPAPGQLFIDGRDAARIPAASIRLAVGYVPQDGFMFNETLRENIDFFSGAGDEAIARAADSAGLSPDIEAMPEGFETLAGERGNHFSGGQRQRAALARALARDPRILLLDDTLSAVDSRTESRILETLKSDLAGRTAIIISHKLSALRGADHIIYLDNGRAAEEGTHEELIARGGAYAFMYGAQAEGAGA